MAVMDSVKSLCCTWSGINKVKKTLALACGGLIIGTSVLSLLNPFDILHSVRSIWNIVFGTIMIFLQLEWKKMIARNFGFLSHWFLRGCFFIFVGTNAMRTDEKTNEGEVIFSLFAGFSCIFVGVVELLFGFKCAGPDDDVEAAGRAGSGGRSQTEPTLTVNLTPNQVAGAAGWAAANAGTVAKVANAASSSGSSSNAHSDNPFFNNQHRT